MTAESKGNARLKTSQLNLSQSSPPQKAPGKRLRHLHCAKSIPAIVPDGIYTHAQLIENLGISANTLSVWSEFNGLEAIQPGTRSQFYLGAEIIAFMTSHRGGIDKPTAKEKIERRKGGAK